MGEFVPYTISRKTLDTIRSLNPEVDHFYHTHIFCRSMTEILNGVDAFDTDLEYYGFSCLSIQKNHLQCPDDIRHSPEGFCICHTPCNKPNCWECDSFAFGLYLTCNGCMEDKDFDDIKVGLN